MTNTNRRVCWTAVASSIFILSVTSWFVQKQSSIVRHGQAEKCGAIVSDRPIRVESMSAEDIFDYLRWTNSTSCKLAVDFGFWIYSGDGVSAPDGHKAVCLDSPVSPVYGDCLVYSFGINNQWTFDDAMAQFGCQVYSFDPSMAVGRHDRSEKIHFYNIGLGDRNGVHRQTKWNVNTADSIYAMLSQKHGEKLIDVLKLDIELSEWKAIRQMLHSRFLTDKVKQLAVEIHFGADDRLEIFRQRLQILHDLESTDGGQFFRFSSRVNPWLKRSIRILDGKTNYIGYELAWYNSKFYNGQDALART